jgi:hypothetical protein
MASSTEYTEETWSSIKKEWLAGQLSISDISRTFGPSRSAIRGKAKTRKWGERGSLVEEVRKEIESQLLEDEGVPAGVPPSEASDIVESAAKRGVTVVRRHRGLLSDLLDIAAGTLKELREMELITLETYQKRKTKAMVSLVSGLAKHRLEGMRVVSGVLNQAIPLERQAYSLDKDGGGQVPIKYVAPKYKKPAGSGLSEDEWTDDISGLQGEAE